jgi:threonine dehydrogenase-like Zn-dependent dehydrogenase
LLAGRIVARGRIELIEMPEPELDGRSSGEIIFQPERACLCGSDLPYFVEEHPEYPLAPGHSLHEMIGIVTASSGSRFHAGERVLAVPIDQQGLFARFRLGEERAIPLDPRAAPEHALLAQPLGTAIFALKKLPPLIDQDVAIVGQGPMGQIFCSLLRNLGAREIIAIDRLASRLEMSSLLGATAAVCSEREDPIAAVARITAGAMADVVIEAVGHRQQALNLCIELARKGGRILSFGVPPRELDGLRWRDLFFKNITVHTSVNPEFRRDFPLAMRWIAEGRIELARLITHRFPLAEIQAAYETFRDKKDGAQKVLVEFSPPAPP